MRLRKHILTCCAALALTLCGTLNAFALEVPTETVVRNLDGVQEYVKVYTVPPETNAEDLIEPDFDYNGYTYACTDIVKEENVYSDTKTHTESVSMETENDDLDSILAALEPSIVYDDQFIVDCQKSPAFLAIFRYSFYKNGTSCLATNPHFQIGDFGGHIRLLTFRSH